ncbi:HEAT repeat-containing protein [Operophtera brumata]|uniref:HEAT repeat-containing protein n=1 Tax=Operophtera brumata TaxID=104452 RepID=A0A0L7LIF4_OPEBR|nr:HEAT repeat-containing protein [Operophtera brumata]
MSEAKPKLKDNPRGSLEPYLTALQSESKLSRKKALDDINAEIFENEENGDCDLTAIFPEVYAYVLKSFSDPSELCRDASATIVSNFIEKLPLNDYYLTYILPVIVRRIGCPEIIEESEEIRLVLIGLVRKVLDKYKVTHLLSPFINDFTSILTKTSTDPYPKVKLEACECIIQLTKILQRDFHFQSESYVKPVLSNFAHQHFRLFDENAQVRMQVTLEVGNWMLNYRDRYSFWHRMIPLLLTSKLWADVGLQYMEENEEDLKKKTDFLQDVPTHYPDVKRPNLGCRTLVMSNIGKILLCWLVLCAEEGGTQHAQSVVRSMLRGAGDDDDRVVSEAEMDSWPALLVLANILKGSKAALVTQRAMAEICQELSDPDRCRTRKPKYQRSLLHVCEALMDLCCEDIAPVAEQLFIINFTGLQWGPSCT